jgi:Ni,Fe-hydrogenase III large subunit
MKDSFLKVISGRWRNWKASGQLRCRISQNPDEMLEVAMTAAMEGPRGHLIIRINLGDDGKPKDVDVREQ